jgi:hypothetical protein
MPPNNWRDRITALSDEDVAWVERQWEMANGQPGPIADTFWIQMETVGDPMWPLLLALALVALMALGAAAYVVAM